MIVAGVGRPIPKDYRHSQVSGGRMRHLGLPGRRPGAGLVEARRRYNSRFGMNRGFVQTRVAEMPGRSTP
jgi:hypothetical protein